MNNLASVAEDFNFDLGDLEHHNLEGCGMPICGVPLDQRPLVLYHLIYRFEELRQTPFLGATVQASERKRTQRSTGLTIPQQSFVFVKYGQ